jgi:ketosteroid isomerase-like protein
MRCQSVRRRQSHTASLYCLAVVFGLLSLTICAFSQQTQPAKTNRASDESEIREMISKYARSVDEADTTLASQVWLDSPDVSFIHPLGYERGFDQIKENVYRRLMGDTFSERKLTPRDISVHAYGDSAWAEFYWDFAAKFKKDGTPLTTNGRETQVYRRTADGWRLVHVHYSGMPVAEKEKGF